MSKFIWYLKNIRNLCVVLIRLLIYFIVRPKKIPILLFSLFSTINEFYQVSHGKLMNFYNTKVYDDIQSKFDFSKANIFNSDPKVARPMETQVLSALVSYYQPKAIFEIGTYSGYTALHVAQNTPEDSTILCSFSCPLYTRLLIFSLLKLTTNISS